MVFKYNKPEPCYRYPDNAKLCPTCLEENKIVEIKGKSFLCKNHYAEYRREREKARIRQKRKEFPDHEVNKLGTTDFGSNAVKKPDGKIDYKKEWKIVHNEYQAVFHSNTPGYKRRRKQQNYREDEIPASKIITDEEEWMIGDDGWEIRKSDYDDFVKVIKKKSEIKESATHINEEKM